MAKPGSYAERQQAKIQAYVQATCDIYSQYVGDMALITLHETYEEEMT